MMAKGKGPLAGLMVIGVQIVVLLSLGLPSIALAQDQGEAQAKKLIVMIDAEFPGSGAANAQQGAGIVFGSLHDRIYIATAYHVVRQRSNKRVEASRIRVRFSFLPGEKIRAQLLHQDRHLDLAVLSVRAERNGIPINVLPWKLAGDSADVKREDIVYTMGNPRGQEWGRNVTTYSVYAAEPNSIKFAAPTLMEGYSGGGLFDDQWFLIGMIQEHDPPYGNALPLARLLQKVRSWGYLARLRKGAVPSPSPNPALVKKAQSLLLSLGYDVGAANGISNPRTEWAVRAFQSRQALRVDGKITQALINELEKVLEPNNLLPLVNLTGTWYDSAGQAAVFRQNGNQVVGEVRNPITGALLMEIDGTLAQNVLRYTYINAFGIRGDGSATMEPDGQHMRFIIRHPTTGVTTDRLHREHLPLH